MDDSTTAPARGWLRDWRNWVALAARLYLGGMLLVAGAIKMTNLAKFALDINAYHLVPYSFTKPMGYAIPPIEIVVGFLLVIGCFTRVAAALGAILMGMFMIGIVWVWAHGYSIDCGCFGGGGQVDPGQTTYLQDLIRDGIAFLGGAWLVWRPRSAPSVDQWLFGAPPSHPADSDDLDLDDAAAPGPASASRL